MYLVGIYLHRHFRSYHIVYVCLVVWQQLIRRRVDGDVVVRQNGATGKVANENGDVRLSHPRSTSPPLADLDTAST